MPVIRANASNLLPLLHSDHFQSIAPKLGRLSHGEANDGSQNVEARYLPLQIHGRLKHRIDGKGGELGRPSDIVVRNRMLDVAERLYGERGIDAVSLREISACAGSGNSTGVQYHFGSADGLIRAIARKHIPAIDAARADFLRELQLAGKVSDIRSLIDAMFLPLLNYRDGAGTRRFARFVLSVTNSSQSYLWGALLLELQPAAVQAIGFLAKASNISQALVLERQRLIAIMVLTSVFNRLPPLSADDWDDALIDNVLAMAAAAIAPPAHEKFTQFIGGYSDDYSSGGFEKWPLEAPRGSDD